ncbi:amidohydrolase [Erythrobacter rubeus]|uniref:Amidohydrolase n=1 Tax=Erythrobacter rubeus TaxID=2760803 RepID=A0ABR8KY74_9SPHN|nr:amidohydrolase [Erythrobacter rubeus]MBD2843394.1 amidohydrolase [Erythrobacter rubeus]
MKLPTTPLAAAAFVTLAFASAPLTADNHTQLSVDPAAFVAADSERTARVAKQLWDYAELGYLETQSTNLLQSELSAEGFEIESGIADIPTAFVAEWGEGGPVIAIFAEMDALPGINQSASALRDQVAGKHAGHACGHNLFGAGSLTAAIAVKKWLEETGTSGRIRFYGTPAEEGGSGKVYMTRAGMFDDVDVAIHWHPGDENSAAARTSLANRSAKFRFTGISAHAAGAPERGRSALDGAEAMNMMANMLHEHMPQDARMHYVITSGGNAPNVVPDFAEVFYYVRHPDPDGVEEIWTRLENAARGAALGTGTEVDWEVIHGNNPLLVNETLAKVMDEKLRSAGGIEYSAEETEWAEQLQASLGDAAEPLSEAGRVQPYEVTLGYGSTDVGDVSWATPTVGLRTATWVPGTSAHSWQAVAASGHSIGFKGTQKAAEVISLMAAELFTNPELREAARAEFESSRGADYEYRSLLGDREPPLDYRK